MLSLLLLACASHADKPEPEVMVAVDPSVTPAPMPQVQPELPSPDKANVTSTTDASIAAGTNAFASDLYAALPQEGNLFFSPASIETAMAMTLAGAAGETHQALASGLHLDFDGAHEQMGSWLKEQNSSSGDFTLRIVNRIWPAQDLQLEEGFLYTTEASYASDFKALDYSQPEAARSTINGWVSQQTEQRIPELIPAGAIQPSTRLVLTNAVYFLADWASPFEASDTRKQDFTTASGATVQVDMMHRLGTYALGQDSQARVLVLPYKGGAQELILALPVQGVSLSELGPDTLLRVPTENQRVDLALPKLEMGWGDALGQPLSALGMGVAFGDQADFSKMSKSEQLFIDEVVHKAFVKMDEEGTEAAAATAVMMRATSMPMPGTPFVVDQPYLFGIRDVASGALLFVGRVEDPR